MQEKEGLQTAIDFTKFLLTLAGGAIAFVISPNFSAGDWWLKLLSITALILLTLSVIAGLLVFSRGAVMLSEKNYRLGERRIKLWGMINIVSFGISFILLAIVVGTKVIRS